MFQLRSRERCVKRRSLKLSRTSRDLASGGENLFSWMVFEKGMASRSPNTSLASFTGLENTHGHLAILQLKREETSMKRNITRSWQYLWPSFLVQFEIKETIKKVKKNSLRKEQFSPVVILCKVKGISSRHKTRSNKNASEEVTASASATGHLFSPFSDGPDRDLETTINNVHTNHIEHHKLSFRHGLPRLNLTPLSGSSSSPLSELNQEKGS